MIAPQQGSPFPPPNQLSGYPSPSTPSASAPYPPPDEDPQPANDPVLPPSSPNSASHTAVVSGDGVMGNGSSVSSSSFVMPALPSDVLARVLRMSIQGLSPASRYKSLRAAALVARPWQKPAQTLLFRDVVIHSQDTANLWLESLELVPFVTERLELDGRYGQLNAEAAEAVLEKVRLGLKRLRVDFVRGLSSRAFCGANLANVTHLVLHTRVLCDSTPVLLHFQLTHLVLGGSYFPLAFTKALFAMSIDTLINLSLTMQTAHSQELRALINQCLGTLNRLELLSDWCRTSQEFIDMIPYLPHSLETINTCFPDRHRLVSLNRSFNLSRVPQLKEFRLMYLTPDDIAGSPEGTKLREDCERKGIVVNYGFDKEYLREEHLLSKTEALKIYY